MREKLQTLPLVQLKELAKAQGIKGVTGMRKADLIEELCRLAEQEEIIKTAVAPPQMRQAGQSEVRTENRNDRSGKTERSDRGEKTERSDPGTREQSGVNEWKRPIGMSVQIEVKKMTAMRRVTGETAVKELKKQRKKRQTEQ